MKLNFGFVLLTGITARGRRDIQANRVLGQGAGLQRQRYGEAAVPLQVARRPERALRYQRLTERIKSTDYGGSRTSPRGIGSRSGANAILFRPDAFSGLPRPTFR